MRDGRVGAVAGEFARFATVGLLSNAALYIMYLLLTHYGLGHKLAATGTYAIGVAQTFAFNRSWSFRHAGAPAPALLRYLAAYALGYALTVGGLVLFVDLGGYRHQWVQGVLLIVVAAVLFALQKFWVFRSIHGRS